MHTYGARLVTGIVANGANPMIDEDSVSLILHSIPIRISSVTSPSGCSSVTLHRLPRCENRQLLRERRFRPDPREDRDRGEPSHCAKLEDASHIRPGRKLGESDSDQPVLVLGDQLRELTTRHALRQPATKVIIRGHDYRRDSGSAACGMLT